MTFFSYLRRGLLQLGARPERTVSAIHTTASTHLPRISKINHFANAVSSWHIQFLPSKHQDSVSKQNPTLVILCGWLGASQKNLNKYVQLWHKRDVDVLKVTTRWIDLLTPDLTIGRDAPKVVAGLYDARTIYPNVIFHTLSAGGYFYASVLMAMQADKKLPVLQQNLKGVIFDSLADWPWVLANKTALAEIVHPRVMNIMPIERIRDLLLNKYECPPLLRCSPGNIDFFIKRNKVIHANPMNLPSLILYSRIDPMIDQRTMFRLATAWHRRGIPVISQCWRDAPHVELFRRHPEEYSELIESFHTRVTANCDCC